MTRTTKLSSAQHRDLRSLAKHPDGYFGSCTNATMNALERRGLVALEWNGEWPRREHKWRITEAGKQLVGVPTPSPAQ